MTLVAKNDPRLTGERYYALWKLKKRVEFFKDMSGEPFSQSFPPDSVPFRIVINARKHFMTHGFRSVTMDDLATEMGMSKKTLYAHFASKAVLVKAVIANKLDEAEEELETITSGKSSHFADILHQLSACLQKHTNEIQPAFVRDMAREAPALYDYLAGRRRKMIERSFVKLLTSGREARWVRDDIPTEFLVEILLAAVESIAVPKSLAERGITINECLNRIISTFMHGVLTDQGRAAI